MSSLFSITAVIFDLKPLGLRFEAMDDLEPGRFENPNRQIPSTRKLTLRGGKSQFRIVRQKRQVGEARLGQA